MRDVDVEQNDVNALRSASRFSARRHRTAAERDHRGLGLGERHADGVRLDLAEPVLAALLEELRDRLAGALLDRVVEVDERPAEPRRELAPERRLARAHEADERDVAVERVQDQS